MLLAQGRFAEAAGCFDNLVTLAPGADPMAGLAYARQMQGALDEAALGFEAALRLQPHHVDLWRRLELAQRCESNTNRPGS